MNTETYIYNYLPEEFRKTKKEHYKEIFGKNYKELYEESKDFNYKEKTLIMRVNDEQAARAIIEFNKYDVRMRDFTVLKKFRGQGIAKKLLEVIEEKTIRHHKGLLYSKKKAYDIMFLKTYIYPERRPYDLTTLPYDEKFQMGNFLEMHDFNPYKYNPKALCKEEQLALKIYKEDYPEFEKTLKVYKKTIRNNLKLKEGIKEELKKLDDSLKEIVLKGLDVKLGVYEERGFVSYKYSVCPVCNDMKSSLSNNSNCNLCYIEKSCLEPFNEGFKDDNEISKEYFSKMRDFLR